VAGDPETLLIDSTLLAVMHPRQVSHSASFYGAAWVRWGSFSVYGVKLHLLCAANRVPLSYELPPANVAEVYLTEELLPEAGRSTTSPTATCWATRGSSTATLPKKKKVQLCPQ
jgi:hypothetical protein